MAIYAYCGLPRQGKSYNVVAEQVIPALKEGRRVVTNIPLHREALSELGCVGDVVQIDQKELADSPGVVIDRDMTAGSVVVLDELWRFIPQGTTAKNVDPAWKTLFAEHGHRVDEQGRMMQIVLVTQDLSQVAAFARALVERTFIVTKLTAIGADKSYRVDVYQGHVTGLKPPQRLRLSESFGKYDQKVFACYQSRTMQEGTAAKVNEKTLDKRASGFRNPAILYGLPAALVLIVGGLWWVYDWMFVQPAEAAAAAHQEKGAKPGENLRRVARSTTAIDTRRWRVSAVLRSESDNDSRVILDECDGGPGYVVAWHAARCVDLIEGGVRCEYRDRRYEFHGAIEACRPDESGAAEIRWFPSDAGRSREPVSVVPAASVDGASG